MLHKEIPFLRIGLPFCAGIVSGLYIKPDLTILLTAGIAVTAGFVLSLFFNKYMTNVVYGGTLTISLFIAGLVLYSNEKKNLSILKQENTLFSCTVSDYPEEKVNSTRLKVKLDKIIKGNKAEEVRGSILLYYGKKSVVSSFLPGDLLLIRCSPSEIVNRANPYEFDYKFYMENHGIRYFVFITDKDIISHTNPSHRKLIHQALITRQKIISMYRDCGITGESLAIAAAITLGDKSMLEPDQKLVFMKAGVMHIMAVSGLHTLILSLFVFNLLFFMKGRFDILRIFITIVILWAFAFVTGLTPSVLRATLMFSFLQTGKLIRRPSNSINSVLASAFMLTLLRPSVIFDAGFLLSYSAVIFIISFYKDFYQTILFKSRLTDKIWQSGAVSVVAQAGTLPLTIMLFNRFPTLFILANITILPMVYLLIVAGCLIPIFFHIHFVSHLLGVLLNHLTLITESLTSFAASLPFSTLENIGMTTSECVLLTATIFLFCHFILKKRSIKPLYPAIVLLIFVSAGTIREISSKRTSELVIYNAPGLTSIGIRTGKLLNLYSDTLAVSNEARRHSSALGLRTAPHLLNHQCICLKANREKILITDNLTNAIIRKFTPDVVVLTGLRPGFEYGMNLTGSSCIIIVTSQAVTGYKIPVDVTLPYEKKVHYVRKSGAYVKRI